MAEKPLREYSHQEVRAHGHADDLWMILYNKVYDVTAFTLDHPGGAEVLFDCAGVDATAAFEDVGHSQDAVDMLAPYLVGQLVASEWRLQLDQTGKTPLKTAETPPKTAPLPPRTKRHDERLKHKLLVAVLALLAMVALIVVAGLQRHQWGRLME